MNINEAQVRAAAILVEQGFSIPAIGRAFEKVEKNIHCLRHYSRNIAMARPGTRRAEDCPIDGCLAAVKVGGRVRFGFSVVHPNDFEIAQPKKVTGLVAAAKAYLDPEDSIPLRFAGLFENSGEPNPFMERCASYFKVRTISANVIKEVREWDKGSRTPRKIGYETEKVVVKMATLKTATIHL